MSSTVDANAIVFLSDFLYKSICFWYLFVEAVQMRTHNISVLKKYIKVYQQQNYDCMLIGICA